VGIYRNGLVEPNLYVITSCYAAFIVFKKYCFYLLLFDKFIDIISDGRSDSLNLVSYYITFAYSPGISADACRICRILHVYDFLSLIITVKAT